MTIIGRAIFYEKTHKKLELKFNDSDTFDDLCYDVKKYKKCKG